MKLGRAQSIIIEQLPKRRTRHREARTDFLPIKKDDEAAVGCRVEQVKVGMLRVFFDTDDCKEPILLPRSMFVMFHVVVLDLFTVLTRFHGSLYCCCLFSGLWSSSTSHLDFDRRPIISRESTFYLYFVKVESRFSRNRSSGGIATLHYYTLRFR